MKTGNNEQHRIVIAICFLAIILAAAGNAFAGTLVFSTPYNQTNCQADGATNTCGAYVTFGGGTFKTVLGTTNYVGGYEFPYCISPTFGMDFYPTDATDVSITIVNDSSTDDYLQLKVTDRVDPDAPQGVVTTYPLQPFNSGQTVTLTATGVNIENVRVTVVNSVGYPDYDQAAWRVTTASATQPIRPTVDLKVSRNGDGTYAANISYTFPSQSVPAGRFLSLDVLPRGDQPGVNYLAQTGLGLSGTIVQPLATFDSDRTLRATASACDGIATADAAISCTHCKGPATSVGGPVRLFDGVMTYGDTDPLPATLGAEFHREYSSGSALDGRFGQGWTSIFDASAVPADASNKSVSVVNEDRTSATFRLLSTGQWSQTWPQGGVAGTLTGSEAVGYA